MGARPGSKACHRVLSIPSWWTRSIRRGIYAAGDGFFLSLDAGETWSELAAPPAAALALDAASTGVVYLLDLSEGRVYRSEDSGNTWNATPMSSVTAIATDPHIAGVVYAATRDQLFKSCDFGRNWMPTGIVDFAINAHDGDWYAFSPSSGCTGPLTTPCGVFRSSDEGHSWQAVSLERASEADGPEVGYGVVFADPRNNATLYILPKSTNVYGRWNGLYRSADAGASWDFLPVGAGDVQVFALGIPAK